MRLLRHRPLLEFLDVSGFQERIQQVNLRQLLAARHLKVGDVVALSGDPSGANPRRFRIAGAYEPMADPIRVTSERLEVRLHLPDLLDLAAGPDEPLAAEALSAINVKLKNPDDASAFAQDLSARVPTVGVRASRGAEGDRNAFVVLGRFHLAIASSPSRRVVCSCWR